MAKTERIGVTIEAEERQLDRERNRVYRLTIRHPGKLNVLGRELIAELAEALDRIAFDSRAAAVIVTGGGGRSFVGGADLRELVALSAEDGSARSFIESLHGVCRRLRELGAVSIARIDGHCLGAGLEVAASCDLRVSSRRSRFGMPEVLVGVPSVIEAALLPRLIGLGATSDLLLTGRVIEAEEARWMGLVDRLADREQLDAVLESLVEEVLAAAPRALALQKELIRQWCELPLAAGIEAGVGSFEDAYRSDEPVRYQRRFLERKR